MSSYPGVLIATPLRGRRTLVVPAVGHRRGEYAYASAPVVSIPVPEVLAFDAQRGNPSLSVTASVSVDAGLLLLACVTHRSSLTAPAGWTLLAITGPDGADGTAQRQSVLWARSVAGVNSATFTQATVDQIDATLVALTGAGDPTCGAALTGSTTQTVTATKPWTDLTAWCLDASSWGFGDWTFSPASGLTLYQDEGDRVAGTYPERCAIVLDAAPVGARTFTANTSSYLRALPVRIPAVAANGAAASTAGSGSSGGSSAPSTPAVGQLWPRTN